MKKRWPFALAAAGLLWMAQPGNSCIAIPRQTGGQPAPVMTLDEQRAFLWHVGNTQHMLLSVQYRGGTDEFAWVVPVESRPKVEVEKGAPFTELRRATEMADRPEMLSGGAPGGAIAPAAAVTVLERKEEGPYDLAVLKASETGGLYDWLRSNGFAVSKNVRGALEYYVSRKYVFLAARIRSGEKGRETISRRLREGAIAPIHLSFRARKLTYPLRVTAGNPGRSKMEIYALGSGLRQQEAMRCLEFQLKPQGQAGFAISGPEGLANPTGQFPTLRRLIPKGGALMKCTGTLDDDQRQQDLVFADL